MKKSGMFVLLLLAVVALVAVGALGTPTVRIIYSDKGNTLSVLSGDKSGVELPTAGGFPRASGHMALVFGTKHVSGIKITPYGDKFVSTSFDSFVEIGYRWAGVYGTSQTLWLGTQPQWNSSAIKLTDSWTFTGFSVSISYPPSVGLSSSGNTVTWNGDDWSGEVWGLQDTYSGIEAEGLLTGFRQVSLGAHFFKGPSISNWVTACARGSC